MSAAAAERIALDVHAHLAPVLDDRLAAIAGVQWSDDDGAMTIDGYTLAAKSVYRPEALLAWMDEHRVERAWISIPPPLYRLGARRARRCGHGLHYANDGLDALAAKLPDRLSPLYHLPVTQPALAAEIVAARAKSAKAALCHAGGIAGSQGHPVGLSLCAACGRR